MVIKTLYTDYFQKSRLFLYPALGIKKGGSVTPIETYMCWKNHYRIEDAKFCCLYHIRNDMDFKLFEHNKLFGNKLFFDFKQVEDNKGVYVFDFSDIIHNWAAVVTGKYSTLTNDYKKVIRQFVGLSSSELPYVDSFLFPERHFKIYSQLMNVEQSLLEEVGELCSLPDMDKETLDINVMDLLLNKENA
jgi:hypothetical protein